MHRPSYKKPWLRLNGLALGVVATWVWILFAGLYVHHRHQVPSLAEFKSASSNVAICTAPDVRLVNQCLDDRYAALMSAWRTDVGKTVVLPPMLGWIGALLHSLAHGFGLFRRRQRA